MTAAIDFMFPKQGRARTEGWVQSARPVGAVRALPGHRDRARSNPAAPGLTRGLTFPHQTPDHVRGCVTALAKS